MDDFLDEIPDKYYGFIYHYYRAEVYRETNFRNRLDTTINWSIVVTAGILSFAFGNKDTPHTIILLNIIFVCFFLYIESRRFRYYVMLRMRTRLIENNILTTIFDKKKQAKKNWEQAMSQSFQKPQIPISRLESIVWRFRRHYFILFFLLILVWMTKIASHPETATNLEEMLKNANVWFIPGSIVTGVVLGCFIFFSIVAFYVLRASPNDDLP